MRILIVTQVIHTEHPVLGFFHRWVERLADRFDHVQVIALEVGSHSLPTNVTVHSLGKETGKTRWGYVTTFFKLLWQLRGSYDGVFVHMNQEYVLLAGWWWKVRSIPCTMWRNHYSGSWRTRLAGRMCTKVFYTSSSSYTCDFPNSVQMPIGIDPNSFSQKLVDRKTKSLLFVGRVSPSKNVLTILQAFKQLVDISPEWTLTIVGGASDEVYLKTLQEYVALHKLPVVFRGAVAWADLPDIYSRHELCINLSAPGMFDKVIGEAILCGCDIVTTNRDLQATLVHRSLEAADTETLTSYLQNYQYNAESIAALRSALVATHSLDVLVDRLLVEIKGYEEK